jgi:AcrR family transcriptional regulator
MEESGARREKRERVLQAALAAYARYGIHEATARQIADIAGIGKSTIFEYYKSTDELMDAAFASLMEKADASRAGMRETALSDPAGALRAYFGQLTSLIVKEPQKLLLLSQYITALLSSGRDFSDVKREYGKKLQPFAGALMADFEAIAESGIKTGVFRPCGGLGAKDCALALSAFAREMQSQAFIQDEAEIVHTCRRIERAAFGLLGYDGGMEV